MRAYHTFVWNHALDYLEQRADMNAVRRHMTLSEGSSPESTSRVYQRLLESLSNRQGMPYSIGSVERLAPVLFAFDFHQVLHEYQADWTNLFDAIQNTIRPSSKMDKGNSHNFWTVFCKGAISAAQYLQQFDSLDEFLTLVKDFDSKLTTRPALPLLLGKEIYGLGFALACDFLKEMGFTTYSKPDVHLLDIFPALGIAQRSELAVFRAVSLMASEVAETPYAVDKAFWLIGSGWLYLDGKRFPTNKHEFIQQVLEHWRLTNPTAQQPIRLG